MKCTPDEIVRLALLNVGEKEDKNGKNKYAKLIDERFPNFYNGKKNGFAWCDVFVDYLFLFSFGEENALRLLCQPVKSAGASCTYSASRYKIYGQFGKEPKIGAQIFFSQDGGKTCYHTGIVVGIEGNDVITVEGNVKNMVNRLRYNKSDGKIYGYGYPRYDGEGWKTRPVDEIAKEVIAGKWGAGGKRKAALRSAGYKPDEIQELVNKILAGGVVKPTTSGTLKVSVDLSKYNKIELEFTGV